MNFGGVRDSRSPAVTLAAINWHDVMDEMMITWRTR